MSKTKWTDNQKKAIDTPASVLVNAAAGSGKTAVLVERIIKKIISGETEIDRLLIVTFAKDAAAQMQQRIKKALNECILSSDDECFTARMRKQLRALNSSDITTIDAFCISVVRKNFHLLGIDPGFKIIDAEEAKIMLSMELDAFIDNMYEKEDSRIELLSDYYSNGFKDISLKEMIKELYIFTRSLPEPSEWLRESAQMYKDFKNSKWFSYINSKVLKLSDELLKKAETAVNCMMNYALGTVKDIKELTESERFLLEEFDSTGLWKTVEADMKAAEIIKLGNWDDVVSNVENFSSLSKAYMSGNFKEERKEIIDRKNETTDTAKKISRFCETKIERMCEMYEQGIYPVLSVLCEVICEFEEYFFKSKRKKNNYEFNDLEHMCYRLLADFEDVREEYSKKYDEILMDEYQDTNSLQEGIFDLISDKRFMVGDMKQSIYRFRNSDPFIFKEKDRLFSKSPKEGTRIVLSENFRSRPEVLTSINEIFSRIMSEQAGEIDYDDSQSLKWGNKSYEEPKDSTYFSELCILEGRDSESDEDDNNVKIEARFIANRIKQMIDNGFLVTDGKEKRKALPGDFVIILNAVKTSGNIYVEELKKVGIDGYSENEGYFDRSEVKLVLALIDIVNNPLQDIPLVAVMRSVLFGFLDDDLAKIRLQRKGSFFDAVVKASETDTAYGKKCKEFCEKLERWRKCAKYMSSDRLIWTLYEETQVYDLMGVMYDGEDAQANLRLLFEKAKQYEKTGFKGLFHFLEYIKRMEENAKVASAALISDSSNAVRIMTIHKSKGLEFPVCFLGGMGKRFPSSKKGKLRIHKDLGIGIDFVDADKGYFSHTAVQELIEKAQKDEEQAESLRKLYVGMTRAKEKLIVVATVAGKKYKNGEVAGGGYISELEKWNTYYNASENVMNPERVNAANRYIDLIAPIVLAHKNSCGWESHVVEYNPETAEENEKLELFEESELKQESIDRLMGLSYNYQERNEIPGKISVTGIEKLKDRMQTEDDISDFEMEKKHTEGLESKKINLKRPVFLREQGLTGAERGTAYHTLFAFIKIKEDMSEEFINEQIEDLKNSGHLSDEEAKSINSSDIKEFFDSDLGNRLKAAKKVYREQPFEIIIGADEALKNEKYSETGMLLQGVIDCLFEEDGNFILLDYKTDRGLSEEEFVLHYKEQLTWYKKAAERLTGITVREAFLYSVEKKKEIKVF